MCKLGNRKPQYLTDSDYENAARLKQQDALLCFVADWSAPCREMAPAIEQLCDRLYDCVSTYLVDLDAAPLLAAEYDVTSIPTLVFVQHGQQRDRIIGLRSADDVEKMVKKHFEPNK